jgi:hypothetical protein
MSSNWKNYTLNALALLLACLGLLPPWSLLHQAAGAAEAPVWAASDGYKIDKSGKKIFVQDPKQDIGVLRNKSSVWDSATRTVTLAGARGETVAFQIFIEGGANGVKDVNIEPSALSGKGAEIKTERMQLYKIYYTELKDRGSGPTNGPSMGMGWYPDALVPWTIGDTAAYGGYDGPPFAVKAGELQGVWVDLAIPYGTPAGEYSGTLKVAGVDAAAGTLTVRVKVRDFDIPRKIHNTLFMNFGMDDLNQAGGHWLKGAQYEAYEKEVYRLSRRHRFTAGNMYNNAMPKIVEKDGALASVDWSQYDARFDPVLNPKNNLFGAGEEAIEIWKVPLFTGIRSGNAQWPVGDKAWDQMIAEIKKHWQEKGWDLSRAYVYLADEPDREVADKLNDFARRVKDSPGPNLRRQIAVYTILGNAWNTQQPVFDLWQKNLDMWMVAGDYYNIAQMAKLPPGALRGMYQGGEPYQGNETLDSDGVALRSWSWIAHLHHIDYQCYYSMAEAWRRAVPDPNKPGKFYNPKGKAGENNDNQIWDEPRNRPWAISQGVFIYPGKKLNYDWPIVNIRMKQIRRGQTDFEYFWLLKQAGQAELADKLVKGVIRSALSDAAPAPENYGPGKWSHNPEEWDEALRTAAAKLEDMKDKLPKEKPGE